MIVKEKLPSRFEEHTLQFTLKIALVDVECRHWDISLLQNTVKNLYFFTFTFTKYYFLDDYGIL